MLAGSATIDQASTAVDATLVKLRDRLPPPRAVHTTDEGAAMPALPLMKPRDRLPSARAVHTTDEGATMPPPLNAGAAPCRLRTGARGVGEDPIAIPGGAMLTGI